MTHDSPLYTAYTMLLQEAIDVSIKLKRKDTQGFILQQDLCQLLQPFIYDNFSIGNQHQITKETYGILFHTFGGKRSRLTSKANRTGLLSRRNYKGGCTNITSNDVMIVLQKGQPIPITGLVIKLISHMKIWR